VSVLQENVNLLNMHHLALFNMEQTHLWLAFWCDFIGAILVVATCLLSVAFSETLGAPNVGLAISNSIQVLVFFTWVVRGVADTVSMWDAIERVTSFATQVRGQHGTRMLGRQCGLRSKITLTHMYCNGCWQTLPQFNLGQGYSRTLL
jgi:hypothetical protein